MKPVDIKSNTYIDFNKEINCKNPKFKMILLEYQNVKAFFQKVAHQIGQKKVFGIKKVENTLSWTYVINNLKGEEIVGTFNESELRKNNSKRI